MPRIPKRKATAVDESETMPEIRAGQTPKEAFIEMITSGRGADYVPPEEIISLPEPRESLITGFSTEGFTPDMIECMQIIIKNDSAFTKGKKLSMRQIAEEMQVTERSLWGKMRFWKDTGIYDRVMAELMMVRRMKMEVAINDVLNAVPAIYARLTFIATDGSSGKNAIEAAKLLIEDVVKPAMANRSEESTKGKDYLSVHNQQNAKLIDPNEV